VSRESLLVATLVDLADNLVDHYDPIEVLTVLCDRCVKIVDVAAAGVMLAQPGGELQFVASSNESMRILELFQIQSNEGPCVDSYVDGTSMINHSLDPADGRWPHFTPRALDLGFRTIHCIAMRLRGRTIGALNLFHDGPQGLDAQDVAAAQGLADVATIAILQHRTSLDAKVLNDQLEFALNSRIIIEQAKGMVSQDALCDMEVAFARLRAHARNRNLRLTDVAARVVDGELPVADLERLAAPLRS
jgi:GAF domain-containing protein